MSMQDIYDRSPVFIQNLMLTAYSALLDRERYGGCFGALQKDFEKMQWDSEESIIKWQDMRLRELIKHAYDTVPYYRDLFDRENLKPDDIKSQADLPKIPVLTRADIQNNIKALISTDYGKSKLKAGHTSGTTGSPLEVFYDERVIKATYVLMDRQYKWAGATLSRGGDRIAVLRGNVIVPAIQKKPPFWRYNYFHNQLLMSAFHLSKDNLKYYLLELDRYQPKVIDGYPSTLYVLARHLNSIGQTFPVKAVITSSETLYDFQRAEIEKAFCCKIFDYFAAAERVIFSTECEQHKGHHLGMEYGITEVLDSDLKPVTYGEKGLLVGTSLHNYGMPMIRYVTNDISSIKKERCPCGRKSPLMDSVSTKAEDIIALRDGRMISPSVLTHPFKPMHSVEESQIIQEDYDDIIIKLVVNQTYSESDAAHLTKEFQQRLGENVNIAIEVVDVLSRTKSGKFKWVISKVAKGIQVPA